MVLLLQRPLAVLLLTLCALFASAHPQAHLDKRALNSYVSVASRGVWGCSSSQVNKIRSAVGHTFELARAASNKLAATQGSSPAFSKWFGDASAGDWAWIKAHYDNVLSQLRPPSSTVQSFVQDRDPHRLTYVCPPKYSNRVCGSDTVAAAGNVDDGLETGGRGLPVNLVYICPDFFTGTGHSKMLSKWRSNKYRPSASLVLLHEMTHLGAVVGEGNRAKDYEYAPTKCEGLDNGRKIWNAQNYAFFALEVLAH